MAVLLSSNDNLPERTQIYSLCFYCIVSLKATPGVITEQEWMEDLLPPRGVAVLWSPPQPRHPPPADVHLPRPRTGLGPWGGEAAG